MAVVHGVVFVGRMTWWSCGGGGGVVASVLWSCGVVISVQCGAVVVLCGMLCGVVILLCGCCVVWWSCVVAVICEWRYGAL